MIEQYSNYVDYLQAVLKERQTNNAAYSLRAMATSLGVSASTLSDVMNGRKKLSEATAIKVGQKLKLPSRKFKYFVTLVQYQSAQSEDMKQILSGQLKALNPKLREHFDVDPDQYRFIADWYHAVILEMTYLTQYKMDAPSIAESLEITIEQASDSLNLLQKLELMEPTVDGRYQKTQKQFKFQSSSPNQALRKFHHQMLEKAQRSLHAQTALQKLIGSETIPLNVEDLPEADDIIESCFQRILELSKKSQKRTHVYHFGIQFFQASRHTIKKF